MVSYPCTRKSPYTLHPVSQKFPQRGPLSSYLGGSFSASSFNASLLQAINGVVSLALCPQVVSQVSQHFRPSENASHLWGLLFIARLSARSFPFTPACPGQYTHRDFWRWMLTIDTFQSGLPIPIRVVQLCTKSRSGSDERLWSTGRTTCTRSLFMHADITIIHAASRARFSKRSSPAFLSSCWARFLFLSPFVCVLAVCSVLESGVSNLKKLNYVESSKRGVPWTFK